MLETFGECMRAMQCMTSMSRLWFRSARRSSEIDTTDAGYPPGAPHFGLHMRSVSVRSSLNGHVRILPECEHVWRLHSRDAITPMGNQSSPHN